MLPRGQAKESALWAYSSAAGDCPRLAAKPCARQSLDPFLMMANMMANDENLFRRSQLSIRFKCRFSSELLGDWTRI
jgi:hypothetical protein